MKRSTPVTRKKSTRRPNPVDLAFAGRAEITACEVEGRCQEVSEAVVAKLVDAGYDAWVAHGSYKGEPHAWVIFDKRYLDPTFDQFGEDDETYVRVYALDVSRIQTIGATTVSGSGSEV